MSGDNSNQAIVDCRVNNVVRIHDKVALSTAHQEFRALVEAWSAWFGSSEISRLFPFYSLDGPLNRNRQSFFLDGLKQVIHGFQLEGFNRVLIKGRRENKVRQRDLLVAQFLDHAEAVKTRHLNVQKDQIRLEIRDQADG